MTRAVARVEQKIIISGADNASDAIKKAQKSLKGLEKSTHKAGKASKNFGKDFADAGDEVAGRSGKLSTALSSLGDFAGKSEGAFRTASEAAGAFDDVLTLLPGPVGLGAAAVAGLTTVLYLHVKATQQAEARLRQAFGGKVLSDIRALRAEFDLSAEASVSLGQALIDSGRSAKDVRDDLRAVVAKAEDVGDDASEAVAKFAAELSKGATASDKLKNRLKALGVAIKDINLASLAAGTSMASFGSASEKEATAKLGKLSEELAKATTKLKDLKAGHRGAAAEAEKQVGMMSRLVGFFDKNSNANHKLREAYQLQTRAIIQQEVAVSKLKGEIRRVEKVRGTLADRIKDNAQVDREVAREEAAEEVQRVQRFNAEVARNKRRSALTKARAAAARRRAQAAKAAAFGRRQAEAGARALLDYQRQDLETEDLITRARLATVQGTRAKIAAEKELIDVATRRQVLEVESSTLDDGDKAKRISAIKALARAETTARIKAIHEASAAARKAQGEAAKREAEEAHARLVENTQPLFDAADAIARAGATTGNVGLNALGRGLSIAAQGALDLKKNLNDIPKATDAAASAVGGVASVAIDAETKRTTKTLEAEKQRKLAAATSEAERARITEEFEAKKAATIESAERRKAAILGAMEVAKAAASYPNIPEMAAHGVAAGLFFGVAGGAFGSGSSATPPGSGGGGFSKQTAASNAPASQSSAGHNVTVNFNQPLTTKQNIGKAVHGALRSLNSTGMAKAQGV